MSDMINLMVNGKSRQVEGSVNLESYLTSFGLNLQFVAVGYNGEVLKKEIFFPSSAERGRYPGNCPSGWWRLSLPSGGASFEPADSIGPQSKSLDFESLDSLLVGGNAGQPGKGSWVAAG